MRVDPLEEQRRSASIRLYGLETVAASAHRGPGPSSPVSDLTELQEVVDLTRVALGADGAGINLLVDDEQVTLVSTATPSPPVARERSICSTMLLLHERSDVLEIADLRTLPELAHNPFVDGSLADLRFYAAAPLTGKHGLALGTLCAWSSRPQHLDDQQRGTLRQFGRSVVHLLDEHRRALVPTGGGALVLPTVSGR